MAATLERSGDEAEDLTKAFRNWIHNSEESLFPAPDNVVDPVPVPAARTSGEREFAEIAAQLTHGAYVADLRAAS